jgi:hypothetical protein
VLPVTGTTRNSRTAAEPPDLFGRSCRELITKRLAQQAQGLARSSRCAQCEASALPEAYSALVLLVPRQQIQPLLLGLLPNCKLQLSQQMLPTPSARVRQTAGLACS